MRIIPLLVIAAIAPQFLACQPLRDPDAPPAAWDRVEPHDVTVTHVTYLDREALGIEFTPELQSRVLQSGSTNVPALAVLPVDFSNGVVDVDVAGEVNGRGGPESRAFVGVAFHIAPDLSAYESVYLRMTNGRLAQPRPPEPRMSRAIQYIAHPDFHFEVSRATAPGQYERAANVAPATWVRLRLEVSGIELRAFINNEPEPSLTLSGLKRADARGRLAFWVGDGTTGYFANLRVGPAARW